MLISATYLTPFRNYGERNSVLYYKTGGAFDTWCIADADERRSEARALKPFYNALDQAESGNTRPLASHLTQHSDPGSISQLLACLRGASQRQRHFIAQCPQCAAAFASWLRVRSSCVRVRQFA